MRDRLNVEYDRVRESDVEHVKSVLNVTVYINKVTSDPVSDGECITLVNM